MASRLRVELSESKIKLAYRDSPSYHVSMDRSPSLSPTLIWSYR